MTIDLNNFHARRGFTLIELILVMALLIVIISIVTPKMAQFFASRSLNLEENRFLALTRYAQSRAVSDGIPMFLWINPASGTYGLQQETGYTDNDSKALDYRVSDGLKIGLGKSAPKTPTRGKFAGIHFSNEGTIVPDTSVTAISLQETGHQPVWIVQSPDGLSYALQ